MNIIEYNKFINNVEIDEESSKQVIKSFLGLKKEYQNKAIIETTNKEKFFTLLKLKGQIHEEYNFSYEDLSNMDLSDFIFIKCQFENTNFENSNMDAIEFESCCLNNAVLHKAVMECACFKHCICVGTDFSNTHLMAVYIKDSDWTKANVSGANLIEMEAHDWDITDMIIDENTSIVEGEFFDVDWSKTNVARLNISLEQVKYFLQCTNGGKLLNVYSNYKETSFRHREDSILKALLESKQNYLDNIDLNRLKESLIFISYASEQECKVRDFYDKQKNKFSLWMDAELIKHEQLRMQLETIMSSCRKAVIFLSKEYMVKAWTRYEFFRLMEESNVRGISIIILSDSIEVKNLIKETIEQGNNIVLLDTIDELINNL